MTACIEGEVWGLGALFGWATMKGIGEKRIKIGRDCRAFFVADSVSFFGK